MSEPGFPSDALGSQDRPDALFGLDGTQLPDPPPVLADALTGSQPDPWQDIPTVPPVPLAPALDVRAMQDAINAALGPNPAAAPAPAGAGAVVRRRPVVPQPVVPAGSQGPGRPVPHRPQAPVPARVFAPARALAPADLRRRVVRDFPPGRPQARSVAGSRTGCVVALLIVGVVVNVIVHIASGIVQSLSVLIH